jgi:hypothetical protein
MGNTVPEVGDRQARVLNVARGILALGLIGDKRFP